MKYEAYCNEYGDCEGISCSSAVRDGYNEPICSKLYGREKKQPFEFKVMRRYYNGWKFLILRSRLFQFRWFTDCGYWFLYIHIGKRYWRFSDIGYLSGKTN